MVCRIANLWDIDLKILKPLSDANVDNCAKFEVTMSRNYISRNVLFERFLLCWPTIKVDFATTYRPDELKISVVQGAVNTSTPFLAVSIYQSIYLLTVEWAFGFLEKKIIL